MKTTTATAFDIRNLTIFNKPASEFLLQKLNDGHIKRKAFPNEEV